MHMHTCTHHMRAGELSIVVTCGEKPVAFQVIARLSSLELPQNADGVGVPLSSEVCPKQWAFHKEEVHLQVAGENTKLVNFEVTVHDGDVYYAMVRWHFPPGFAACNSDELKMSGKSYGVLQACSVPTQVTAHGGTGKSATAYIGLYGGDRCAVYTVKAVPMTVSSNPTCNATVMGLVTGCS